MALLIPHKSYLFISFAPPKEMNQRKGVRKCQLQPKRAPVTQTFRSTVLPSLRSISWFSLPPSSIWYLLVLCDLCVSFVFFVVNGFQNNCLLFTAHCLLLSFVFRNTSLIAYTT